MIKYSFPKPFHIAFGVVVLLYAINIILEPNQPVMRYVLAVIRDVMGVNVHYSFVVLVLILASLPLIFVPMPPQLTFLFAIPLLMLAIALTIARVIYPNVVLSPVILFIGFIIIKLAYSWEATSND